MNEDIYIDCLEAICENWKSRLVTLKNLVKNIPKGKYKLPDKCSQELRIRTAANFIVLKSSDSIDETEYLVITKFNCRTFASFVNKFFNDRNQKFNFIDYDLKEQFFGDLSKVIQFKYNYKTKIKIVGGYIEIVTRIYLDAPKSRLKL